MQKLYATLFEFWNDVEFDDVQLVTPVAVFNNDGDFIGYRKEFI